MLPRTRVQLDALRRDTRRFAALYSALRQRVFRLGGHYRPYASEEMLEDACSDAVLLTLVQHHGHFEADATDSGRFDDALLGYLYQAAHNRLLTSLHKDSRARELFFTPGGGNDDEDAPTNDPIAQAIAADPSPDEIAGAAEQSRLVHDCLEALSELARDTFKLALRGFNDQEIQDELQVASPATVRRRVHDAKQRMMDCVAGKMEGRP